MGFFQGQELFSVLALCCQTLGFGKVYANKKGTIYESACYIQPLQNEGVNSEFTHGNWSKAVFLKVRTEIHLYQNLLQVLTKCKFQSTPQVKQIKIVVGPCSTKVENHLIFFARQVVPVDLEHLNLNLIVRNC